MSIGSFGFYLGTQNIYLPLFLDTACTSLPFFCFGYLFRAHSTILVPNKHDKYLPIWTIACFIFIYLFAIKVSYHFNHFNGSMIALYSCGLIGTLFVIFLSKILKRLPLVSYWGRYSIIILCTHNLVVQFLAIFLKQLPISKEAMCFSNLIITMLLYLLIIPFCIKYLPYVTAQKDVIKV
jgi:fucose 4-O-acetylase-like acetyltransferase